MFQMSKQMFDQCWPAIAALLLEVRDKAAPRSGEAASSAAMATEANYVLGVAMGYALRVDQATNSPPVMYSSTAGERLRRIQVVQVADRAAASPARNDPKSTLTLRRAAR